MKVLLVGNGGRESAIATQIAKEAELYAFMKHQNPTISASVQESNGAIAIGDTNDPFAVAEFARRSAIDLAIVSADNPLEAGVVDALHLASIPTVGPTRAGAEIEWNKAFARQLLVEVLPDYAPRFWIIENSEQLSAAFDVIQSEGMEIVVKPAGLTGGKGVKVMGEHLRDFGDAKRYATQCLQSAGAGGNAVVLEERLEGVEFTVQALTDGHSLVRVPATYDYPFRFDGDTGPGTGGMGSFCSRGTGLPCLTTELYDQCVNLIEGVLAELHRRSLHYSGVLNAGFFLTPRGLKVMEFNARFGDPECINIMAVLGSSALQLFQQIAHGRLDPSSVQLQDHASVTKYLVAPEYALGTGPMHQFYLNIPAIEAQGVQVLFSSAVATGSPNEFRTVGTSRSVALASTAPTPPEASDRIERCIQDYFSGPLEHRRDVGSLESLARIATISK